LDLKNETQDGRRIKPKLHQVGVRLFPFVCDVSVRDVSFFAF